MTELCRCAECQALDRRHAREHAFQMLLPLTPPRKDRAKMLKYLITSHANREGVTLSKPGHWGNMPFPNAEAAWQAAKDDAGPSAPFSVNTETVRRKRAQA